MQQCEKKLVISGRVPGTESGSHSSKPVGSSEKWKKSGGGWTLELRLETGVGKTVKLKRRGSEKHKKKAPSAI